MLAASAAGATDASRAAIAAATGDHAGLIQRNGRSDCRHDRERPAALLSARSRLSAAAASAATAAA
jgi:hypothetical protein